MTDNKFIVNLIASLKKSDTLSSIADIYENLDDIDKIKLMSTFSGYDWSKYLSGAESLDTTLRNIATKSLQSVINQFNGLSGCEPILEELKQKFEDTFNFDFDLSENLAAYEELKELLEDVSKGEVYQKEKIAYLTNKYHDLASAVEDEFLDLSNQLAELFPQLTRDYDDNGNAILGLSGNIDTIVDSLDNLVSVQQKLTNQEILEKMPDGPNCRHRLTL